MSGELIGIVTVGAALAGVILTATRGLRQDINDLRRKVVVVVSLCSVALAGCSADKSVSQPTKEQVEATADCPQNCSDDAQTVEEEFFHAEARAFVIRHVEPNELRVGGLEFRVKRNPVGEGCFVYDPRTRFHAVERLLVWWVPTGGTAYALNSPAKMVTPGLPWPREAGVDAPSTSDVVDYVFHGKPMIPSIVSKEAPAGPGTPTFTVNEYRIYRAVIDTPMSVSESETLQRTAQRYGVSVQEAREVVDKVQKVLFQNGWMSTPATEIRHASDWNGERP